MTKLRWLIALSFCLAACAITPELDAAAQPSGAYHVDPEHSSAHFRIRHLGLGYVVGRFDRFEAGLDFDAAHPALSRLDAVIETASINTNSDRLDDTLRGDSWLAADRYPQIRFTGREIRITGENEGVIDGDLTLRGVTRPAEMRVTFHGGAPNLLEGGRRDLAFSGDLEINRKDFGMTRFPDALVGDTVRIQIEAEFLEGAE